MQPSSSVPSGEQQKRKANKAEPMRFGLFCNPKDKEAQRRNRPTFAIETKFYYHDKEYL